MADTRFQLTPQVERWLDELNAATPALAAVYREHARHPRARMMTHPDVGRLLAVLVRATGGRRVLEIGAFVGVSILWMASALEPGGRLDSLEISDEYADVAERSAADAGYADRVAVHRGPALDTLVELPDAAYDLAYIDADKSGYPAYLRECVRLVRAGGVIAADNLFLNGRAAEADGDEDARAIRSAAASALADPRLTTVALTVGDGLLLATVAPDAA